MRSIFKHILVVMCLCSSFCLNIQANTLATQIDTALQNNAALPPYNYHIGMLLEDARSGKTIYQKNAQQLFIPASIQKLLTAAAALTYLSPQFTFDTELLITGSINKHTLNGDVIIRFSGDPTLTVSDLASLMNTLKTKGITHIRGHVYLDNHAYNHVAYPPGSVWDDLSFSFAPPTEAIIINQNKFLVHLYPQKNAQPIIKPVLPAGIVRIKNLASTTTTNNQHCPLTIYSTANNQYTISGCLNSHYGTQNRALAMRNVPLYATHLIRTQLHQLGITIDKGVAIHSTPARAMSLTTHHSPPLHDIIHTMLKDSNNLMANTLVKKLGEKYYQQSGGWQTGIRAITHILHPLTHINFQHVIITDGSGLSRYNT